VKTSSTGSLGINGSEHYTCENLKWKYLNTEIIVFESLKRILNGEHLKPRIIK
jgi:hypothetical protein